MFIIRQYAACVLLVFMLAALLLAACGIGCLLPATGNMFARAFQAVACRTPTLQRGATRFSTRNVMAVAAEPRAIADGPS